ncbi:32857_t:CDS:1, partial [Racocetra persica]
HGIHLCKSGHTKHLSCGKTIAFNGIFIEANFITTDLITTDIKSGSGDSGGPVFYFSKELNSVNLVGIHAASDKSGNTKAAYTQPIEFIFKNSPFEIHLVNITNQ